MGNSILGQNNNSVNTQQDLVQQIKQFRQAYRGDPKQAVMQMLHSGQITNPQLQQAMQMANQFRGMFK